MAEIRTPALVGGEDDSAFDGIFHLADVAEASDIVDQRVDRARRKPVMVLPVAAAERRMNQFISSGMSSRRSRSSGADRERR